MNEQSRFFDFLYFQQKHFPKPDMLSAKENGIWTSYSTQTVIDIVNKLSAGLLKLGLSGNNMNVEQQDKIAVISKNRPEWLMLDLACQQIGILLCPIYPTTGVRELEFIFNDADIKYVFISGNEILERVNLIKDKTPALINIFSFDENLECIFWKNLLQEISSENIAEAEKLRNSIQPHHCATIIYTSGTTGYPKGVMLSHSNLVTNVINAVDTFPFSPMPKAKALSFLPLNHIFERIASYIYIYNGISIYYAESMESIGENLKEIKPVIFTTVPRLLEKVFEKIMDKGAELKGIKRRLFFWAVSLGERFDNLVGNGIWYDVQRFIANKIIFSKWRQALGGNVKYIITGGAACQVKLLRIFNAANINVYEGYGPTENSPVISVNCQSKAGTKFGTVGLVIKGQQVKIEKDGEICVKGPSIMMGYYKRPDLTNEVIIDGWLHTGDIGEFEDGKYLKITDRKKELFKTSGGKYVAPQVIENKLKESPYIEQIMVVGADQKFVAALIIPSFIYLKKWMLANDLYYEKHEDIISNEKVITLYKKIVASYNEFLNPTEQVKKFDLLPSEWGIDTGEMTPKLSMKRKVIMEKYESNISKLFQ